MGFKAQFAQTVTVDGRSYRSPTNQIEGNGKIGADLSGDNPLAAAKTGSLTTRTNNTDGTLTMDPGHGIVTAARLDLYWATGSRYGVTVGTVATNSVPISGGSGDNLPLAATPITAQVPVVLPLVFTGNNALLILSTLGDVGYIVLRSAGADELVMKFTAADQLYTWQTGMGANPVTGDSLVSALFSHQEATGTTTGQVIVLFD